MGERPQGTLFKPTFNRAVRVEGSQADLSSDGGALALAEVAHRTGLWDALANGLVDPRDPGHVRHSLVSLVRTRVLLMAQGWTDLDDADALRRDDALRVAVADAQGSELPNLASQPTLSRAMATVGSLDNRRALHKGLVDYVVARVVAEHGRREAVVVDVDSFPNAVHGHQQGAVYNGHYGEVCMHPLVAHLDGYVLDVQLRPGNVHTAEGAAAFMAPIIDAARQCGKVVWMRIDAGFSSGEMLDWLDEKRVRFITRLKTNRVLHGLVSEWVDAMRAEWSSNPSLTREATREFRYRAQSWSRERRVIAVMVGRQDGDGSLFDDVFFLCTNAARREGGSADILDRYRKRGAAEHHIGEFVHVIGARLPHASMDTNDAAMLFGCVAYNLVHVVRRGLTALTGEGWSLRRVRERLLKTAAIVIRHARRLIFRIARSGVPTWTLLEGLFATPALAPSAEVTR